MCRFAGGAKCVSDSTRQRSSLAAATAVALQTQPSAARSRAESRREATANSTSGGASDRLQGVDGTALDGGEQGSRKSSGCRISTLHDAIDPNTRRQHAQLAQVWGV